MATVSHTRVNLTTVRGLRVKYDFLLQVDGYLLAKNQNLPAKERKSEMSMLLGFFISRCFIVLTTNAGGTPRIFMHGVFRIG